MTDWREGSAERQPPSPLAGEGRGEGAPSRQARKSFFGRSEGLQSSYDFCARMARRAGSNFYPSFFMLSRPKRRAMEALYAYARHTDDLADSAAPVAERRDALGRWRESLDAALARRPATAHGDEGWAILPALADTVEAFCIPPRHLHAIIEGAEMDLAIDRYETFGELAEYCHRVASAVGLACLHIWGFRGEEPVEPARSCALAFQLTNILRDLKEDAATGRVYLPLEDLRRCDYSVEDLMRGVADERFRRLMALEIDRAREFYRAAGDLLPHLDRGGRRMCGMMIEVYRSLLETIARKPEEPLVRRVRLGRWRKLRIAARWLVPS